MALTHGIDNDEQIFQFDPYEGSSSGAPSSPINIPSHYQPAERTNDMVYGVSETESYVEKGKGSTRIPMPSRSTAVEHDVFDTPLDAAASQSRTIPSTSLTPPSGIQGFISVDGMQLTVDSSGVAAESTQYDKGVPEVVEGKGKEREQPPTLPPLNFTPTELGYDGSNWPSSSFSPSSPGPSSYGSGYGSLATVSTSKAMGGLAPLTGSTSPATGSSVYEPPILTRVPSRRRSLSNLSTHSTRSLAARSMTGIKLRFGTAKPSGNLARNLLFRRREDSFASISRSAHIVDSDGVHARRGSCLIPWCGDFRPSDSQIISPFNNLELANNLEQQTLPLYHNHRFILKTKGRSNSSPLPLSALDIVLPASTDIFTPIPLVVRNYFDEALPRELRLHIFRALIRLHEEDHARAVREGTWSVMKASSSKGRWIGRNRGARELVKLSRVSQSWHKLVFDGQLWIDLDLRAFPAMPTSVIKRLAETGGCFIRSVDLAGHGQITPSMLINMADSLCLELVPSNPLPYTQLTAVTLQGCFSLTTRSLHHLLIRSPSLEKLVVKGLGAVTNTTFEILAVYCRNLATLDASRCNNVDGDGVRALANTVLTRGDHLRLKTLRLSGLKYASDGMMAALGKAAPYLEVLDLSYARQLHNSALEAFIACDYNDSDEDLGVQTVLLSAREIGRELNNYDKYRRRVTRLRHLSLSSCILLTDTACANLAHSVPKLEFLELAGIGTSLKDDGLVHLLNTTPFIRRLDLEDASELTDTFLAAITPALLDAQVSASTPGTILQTGQFLEHLVVSSAGGLSNAGLLGLVRNCTRLRVLEADTTHMGSNVMKEFVKLSRQRCINNAKIVAIDCRGISESAVRSLKDSTRPRLGWRAHEARRMRFLDARDTREGVAEELKIGQDECDESRVVVKTFYSWQTVDAVRVEREKRRKRLARRMANESGGSSLTDDEDGGPGTRGSGGTRSMRWWSPNGSGRGFSSSGSNSPQILGDMNNDGCRIM